MIPVPKAENIGYIRSFAESDVSLTMFLKTSLLRIKQGSSVGKRLARFRHEYPNGSAVELRFYDVREYAGEIENRIFKDVRWAQPAELPSYDFLEADLTLVKDLAAGKFAP